MFQETRRRDNTEIIQKRWWILTELGIVPNLNWLFYLPHYRLYYFRVYSMRKERKKREGLRGEEIYVRMLRLLE